MRRPRALLLAALIVSAVPAASAPLANRDPRDDIFYQIMPIAWRDSDNDAQRFGDFGGMTASLPYLRGLGVTALWMTPIFDSPAYHGYQHMPANVVNPRFGSEAQFLSFVNSAHAESVKVFVDWVAYHVSQNSTYYLDSHNNPASPWTSWLAYTNAANSTFDGGSFTTWNGATVGYIKWNLDNPAVVAQQDAWTAHWLDPDGNSDPSDGIDGFRLDHVLADEGWGYDLAFWQQWKAAMLAVNPSAFTFPEQADWGSHGQNLLVAHDAAFTMPFMFAARAALSAGNAAGLYNEMRSTLASLPAGKTYIALLGNHDVDRLSSNTGNVAGRNKVAAAILMTQPFPPCIYYGDELGMRGTKGNWGTDANDIPMREPMKWNAVAGAPMSNYFVLNTNAYNARFERNNDGRSVPEQTGLSGSLLETYRALIALRRNHVALRRGEYGEVPNSSSAVWAFVRHAEAETLIVAINLSASAATPALDLSAFEVTDDASDVTDVESGAALPVLTTANRAAYPVSLPAYGWRIMRARVTPGPPPPPSPYDGRLVTTDFAPSALAASQALPTSMGDNVAELDQMFLRPQSGGMAVGITGNLPTDGTAMALFFDTIAGGQNLLDTSTFPTPPSGVPELAGLGFDVGFAPDRMLWVNLYGGTVYVDHYTLATGGGGTHRYLGSTTMNSGSPLLSGGTNTYGAQVAWNDSNTAGVTSTSAAGAATATYGFEALLPWADLGLSGAGADVRVMAVVVRTSGTLGNQFLPALAPGTPEPGAMPFSLTTVPGNQYVTQATTLGVPASSRSLGGLSLAAGPNPLRESTTLRFALAHATRVDADVLDVGGRRVRAFGPRLLDAGAHALAWDGRDDAGRPVPAGLYFARVRGEGVEGTARVVVTR